jgi:hypothetical protein
MDIKTLSDLLKRAERLFRLSGADVQARAVGELASVLPNDRGQTVEAFVSAARTELSKPELYELTPSQLAHLLEDVRADRQAFARLLEQIEDKRVTKETIIAAATAYTGQEGNRPPWKSKAAAVKAITNFFNRRAYLTEKAAVNANSDPF